MIKSKSCKLESCNFPRWGKGYCLVHQFLREDKKKKSLKRTYIKKRSKKKVQGLKENKKQKEKDNLFFAEIWNEREHIDFETGEPIYGEPLDLYFHHVLEKKEFPQFRYCKWNIVLVTWETHSKCHNNLDFVPKIKKYREKLKKKHL